MSTFDWPGTAPFQAARFESSYEANVFPATSPLSGDTQIAAIPGDRFRARVTVRAASAADRADVEGFFARVRPSQTLSVHRIAMHFLSRPEPLGTLRGAPQVAGSAAVLATQATIASATNGQTVKRGDMIGFPAQTVMITVDAVVSGGGFTLNFVPPLRYALANGNAVSWSRPPIVWAVVGMPMWSYVPGQVAEECVVELLEVWE